MARYDHTFESELRARGYGARCMWQLPAIENTMIEGMECLAVFGDDVPPRIFIVQTLVGGGWNAFAEVSDKNEIAASIDAAIEIIGRKA